MDRTPVLLTHFVVLFVTCVIYAIIVHRARRWYIRENKTWLMVAIGIALVMISSGALIPFGIVALDTWGLIVLDFCVAGAPMIVGQLMQDAHDRALRTDNNRRRHDEDTRR